MADAIPPFVVKDSTAQEFETHINNIRKQWGTLVREDSEVRSLPDVDNTKGRTLKLEGDHGQLIVVFRQRDVYKIAWGNEDRLFIFQDVLDDLERINEEKLSERKRNKTVLDPLLQQLLQADKHELKSTYGSLSSRGSQREKIQVGREALLKAVNILSTPKTKKEVTNYAKYLESVAESCLVIMLMFSECLRFDDMLKYVVTKYDTGGKVTSALSEMINDWSKLSKKLNIYWKEPDTLTELDREQCKNVMLVMNDSIKKTE